MQDSKFGGQVRSGKDYYQAWDKFADKALTEGDSDDEEDSAGQRDTKAVPKPKTADAAAAAAAAAGASSTAPAPARGPALTERLIAANAGLTPQEKEFNANAEKVKGNEFFRCGGESRREVT